MKHLGDARLALLGRVFTHLVSFVLGAALFSLRKESGTLNSFTASNVKEKGRQASLYNNTRTASGVDWRADVEEFLSGFEAAVPEYTERCKAYLRSPQDFNEERNSFINWKWHFSQYNQDWIMLVNFFLDYAKSGRKGFYVESGANDYLRCSNTAFLDLCLGWDGICVEPLPQYQGNLQIHRNCKLVKNCLSDRSEIINISTSSEAPGAENGLSVECTRMDSLLHREGVSTVDVWSLDVEGFEHKALSGMDLAKIDVKSILMEQQDHSGTCAQFPLDYKLTTAPGLGYRKYRIVSDAFYVKADLKERYGSSGLQFPDVAALDRYFLQLEAKKCQDEGSEFSFFTDGWVKQTNSTAPSRH